MRITKLSLFIAGAVGILMLAVPRAAHAVVATLVQVANTASSPVIAQGIGNQAAQIVQIECGYFPGNLQSFGCAAVPPTGFMAVPPPNSQYTVPAGETLVVTSVDILSGSSAGSPCMSPAFVQLIVNIPESGFIYSLPRKNWIVPSGAGTVHYVYPSGILFSPATIVAGVFNTTTSCTLTLDMHGYLTAQ
jgi:hypothetical protein